MTSNPKPGKEIAAAGTVVFRRSENGGRELLLVHRPRYDDWSLPKGKLDPDEYLAACAVRETREEAGLRVRLGLPVDRIRYPISTGMKTVSYWRGHEQAPGKHLPSDEVDQIAWLPLSQALRQISYPDERALVRVAVEQPDATPLLLVRHAKAMSRANWSGRDQARPLDERGRRQSRLLVPLLDAYGVQRLAASTAVRCQKTLQPYAKANGLDLDAWTTLTEEQGEQDPKAVAKLTRRLVLQAASTGVPTAICGHRPLLPLMLTTIGTVPRPLQPGAVLVAHLGPDAEVLSVELHKPRI